MRSYSHIVIWFDSQIKFFQKKNEINEHNVCFLKKLCYNKIILSHFPKWRREIDFPILFPFFINLLGVWGNSDALPFLAADSHRLLFLWDGRPSDASTGFCFSQKDWPALISASQSQSSNLRFTSLMLVGVVSGIVMCRMYGSSHMVRSTVDGV